MTETWQPAIPPIKTRWSSQVDPENPLPEYPRPHIVREEWLNLNGLWDYAIRSESIQEIQRFDGKILVPFAVESSLSGVGRALMPDERLWYRREFSVPSNWNNQKVLIHFGAVDWQARIWINGDYIGEHTGGYYPFSFEISEHLDWGETNRITIVVRDPTDSEPIERGKQSLSPNSIWYSAVSGIWQTVWLEPVPQTYIQSIRLMPDIDSETLTISVEVAGEVGDFQVRATALDEGTEVARESGPSDEPLVLPIAEPKLWSPEIPHLYDLQIRLLDGYETVDTVESYFGMRKFGVGVDPSGTVRLTLNNEPYFFYGPLDQGYWPDGLYTAPTEEALTYDIQVARELGFNTIRKHVKVEPARWYYHCDRMGVVVWQDMINGGKFIGQMRTLLALFTRYTLNDTEKYERVGRDDLASRANYRKELKEMVDALYNFPCIGQWVPFNEGWGQFDAEEITSWIHAYDPSRPVDHASGWFDQSAGEIQSDHIYFKKLHYPSRTDDRAAVISEFGGYSLQLAGHLWNPGQKFGYRSYDNRTLLTDAYMDLIRKQLIPLVRKGLSGAIYTQLTDVEIEVNGMLTYDRAMFKMIPDKVKKVHQELIDTAKNPPG